VKATSLAAVAAAAILIPVTIASAKTAFKATRLRGVPPWARNLPEIPAGSETPGPLVSNGSPTPQCPHGRNWMTFTRMAGATGFPDWATGSGNAYHRGKGGVFFTSCKPPPKQSLFGGGAGIGALVGGIVGSIIPVVGTAIGAAVGGAVGGAIDKDLYIPGYRISPESRLT
jgi:hypothetical protein